MSSVISNKKLYGLPIYLKIFLAFFVVCCFLSVIAGSIYYNHSKHVVLDSIREHGHLVCEYIENEFEVGYSTPIERELQLLATSPQINNYLMSSKVEAPIYRAEVEELFLNLLRGSKIGLSTMFLDVTGNEKIAVYGNKRKRTYRSLEEIATDGVFGWNLKALFDELRLDEKKKFSCSEPFYDSENRLGILVGITKQEPEAGGFGGAVIQYCDLTGFIDEISENKVLDAAVMWAYKSDWEVLLSPPKDQVHQDPKPFLVGGEKLAASYIYTTECKLLDSKRAVVTVACSVPRELISKELVPIIWSVIAIFSGLLVVSMVTSLLISRWISHPIKKLTKATIEIGSGNLDVDLAPEVIESGGEIGALARAFKKMSSDLKSTTTSIDNLNEEIAVRKRAEDELSSARQALEKRLEELALSQDAALNMMEDLDRENVERKKAEEAIRESEQRLSAILESILTGVVIIDAETHQIIDVNPLGMALIGSPKEEIVGKVCHKFICPAEEGKCPISDLGQKVDQSERILLRPNGREVKILKTVTPMTWQGRKYLIESFVDISELKEAEERQAQLLDKLESVNQELKDFAYIVSHDLKAPLRGIKSIIGFLSADYTDKLDDDGKKQLELLVSRVDRMQALIEGVLNYSRVGRIEEDKTAVDLGSFLPQIIDFIAPPENISVTIENEMPVIMCERTRISQVFQNLLSNAVKYMDKTDGMIKVGCVKENDFWKFSVADNGPGIEEKHFETIFKVFQTLNRRDEVEGTGIGLSVVKKIISTYGGSIWVESEVGKGSTFLFTLPLSLQATETSIAEIGARA